jgi:hypothetical protein
MSALDSSTSGIREKILSISLSLSDLEIALFKFKSSAISFDIE